MSLRILTLKAGEKGHKCVSHDSLLRHSPIKVSVKSIYSEVNEAVNVYYFMYENTEAFTLYGLQHNVHTK